MLIADRPSRSKVVITRVSPSCRDSRAWSKPGRLARAPLTPCQNTGQPCPARATPTRATRNLSVTVTGQAAARTAVFGGLLHFYRGSGGCPAGKDCIFADGAEETCRCLPASQLRKQRSGHPRDRNPITERKPVRRRSRNCCQRQPRTGSKTGRRLLDFGNTTRCKGACGCPPPGNP
jgi:hypothetical protein